MKKNLKIQNTSHDSSTQNFEEIKEVIFLKLMIIQLVFTETRIPLYYENNRN